MNSEMTKINVEDLASALEHTRVSASGVSFAGKGLKLDSACDARPVSDAIDNCKELQYLNLEGNTLGVEASETIAHALEKHPEFKRALWKDMFTGRMKTEIPKALVFLGNGLVSAGARLTELDLSDNAFGPIGVEGLATLLRSSSCYALEELRLNNNGLGITGGKLLASALTDCYNCSKNEGKPLALKVFIAGRNRLENDGAKALASVFKMIRTLEEIAMPQNGIYHKGISALSEAFSLNQNLQILNLNDNTVGVKGALAIAKVLPNLQNLKKINFGDCLLKTKGATLLANALQEKHDNLEELLLDFNEIRKDGAIRLIKAMANKGKIKTLGLDGNEFGESGRALIKDELKQIGKVGILETLNDDESEDTDEEDEEDMEGTSQSDENEEEEGEQEKSIATCTVEQFLNVPTADNFLALGDSKDDIILNEALKQGTIQLDHFIPILMKVASLTSSKPPVAVAALSCTEKLCKELFDWSKTADNNSSLVNNTLLVNLGLIKSEDKKFKPSWNLDGCLSAFEGIFEKPFVPESTRKTLKMFMDKKIANR